MKYLFFTLLALLVFVPSSARAATFHFDNPYEVKAEETVISVLLNTQNDKVNAVGGTIVLPSGIEISKISTGNSILVFWVEPPVEKDGKISFAGIVPGGFQGDGILFSFTLKSGSLKQSVLEVTDGEVRRNDATATLITYKSLKTYFALKDGSGKTPAEFADTTAPEEFTISINKDPEFLNGAYFASFSTQDKGTGIQKYEWATTWFGKPSEGSWESVVSPLTISGSNTFKTLYVRAIDNSGNIRVEKVGGPYRYAFRLFEVILGVLLLWVLCFFVRRYFSRSV